LTGGPGCSSLLALMAENGPYHVLNNLSLEINPYSWNTKANIMWIDQPSGTGYSYDESGKVDGVYTENVVADDLYEFLQLFFAQYPKYNSLDFYVTGESYAGHYVPHVSRRIYDGNQNLQPGDVYINLKGLAIGDGLVDPYYQYPEYAPYAYDNGLISEAEYKTMEAFLPVCEAEISYCSQNSTLGWTACINAYDMCNLIEVEPVILTGVNPYDIREQCEYPPLCYNFDNIDSFYNEESTIEALGAAKDKWMECNRIVEMRLVFAGDWMLNFAEDLPILLENDIRVLIYHGEYDFICNWYGGFNWMKHLEWKYQDNWLAAANTTWYVDGEVAGYNKSSNGFTFLKVLNAGHMVPMDQPVNALAMIEQFTFQGGF